MAKVQALSVQHCTTLYDAFEQGDVALFKQIETEYVGAEMKHVPVRLYVKDAYYQELVQPEWSLEQSLGVFAGTHALQVSRVQCHGVALSADEQMAWLYARFRYYDGYLHLVAKEE